MTSTIVRFWFAITVLIGLSLSCRSDDAAPKQPQYRIIKVAETAFDFEITITYKYDSLGRLSLVKEYASVADSLSTITPTAQTSVLYDPAKPTHIDHVDRVVTKPTTDADGLVAGIRRTYSYDSEGRVFYMSESKALTDFNTLKFVQALQYNYGSDNLPSQLIVSGPAPLSERDLYTFTFTNGNATRINLSITSSRSSSPSITTSDVQFDNAPNPYYNYFAIYPGITSFDKNNIVNTNTTMFNDERGLLIKRVKKGNYIDDVTIYTYETH